MRGPPCKQPGRSPPFQRVPGVVQKVGFAEGAKRLVSSTGLGGAGRSEDYCLLTAKGVATPSTWSCKGLINSVASGPRRPDVRLADIVKVSARIVSESPTCSGS